DDTNTSVASRDAKKFKEEYESLNDTIRESDGAKYNNVTINEDNPIKYIDVKEAIEILKNKKGIIYIGANWCPWCRNAVPVLFDVAKSRSIDIIYYLNLDDEKDNFEIKNGTLIKTKEGTESYYELLELLKDELEDYILTDDKGKEYDTKEKRIYIPLVIATKDGKVEATHTGTVTLNKDQTKYSPLTEDQRKELYDIYDNMFAKIYKKAFCNDKCN
ncbi:MAG: hypothetical protein K2J20_04655, partial [Bacilli bacterium]|nr:hypothetical protein [Bacilli bacterium]